MWDFLEFTLMEAMSCEAHIGNVVRTCFFQLRQLKAIRNCIPLDTAKTSVNAFVVARLDYCNSLLAGVPSCQLDRLQSVFNAAVRLVCRASRPHHAFAPWWASLASLPRANHFPAMCDGVQISLQRSAGLPARSLYASEHEQSSVNTTVGIWLSINCTSNKDKSWWTCFFCGGTTCME